MAEVRPTMPALHEVTWAAGFIDGEGSIGVYRSNGAALMLSLDVAQVDRRPLEELSRLFGGTITLNPRRGEHPIYQWRQHSANAARTLALVAPYLRSKKEQAELAVEFQAYQQTSMRRVPVTPEVAARKAAIAAELKRLKQAPSLLLR